MVIYAPSEVCPQTDSKQLFIYDKIGSLALMANEPKTLHFLHIIIIYYLQTVAQIKMNNDDIIVVLI